MQFQIKKIFTFKFPEWFQEQRWCGRLLGVKLHLNVGHIIARCFSSFLKCSPLCFFLFSPVFIATISHWFECLSHLIRSYSFLCVCFPFASLTFHAVIHAAADIGYLSPLTLTTPWLFLETAVLLIYIQTDQREPIQSNFLYNYL